MRIHTTGEPLSPNDPVLLMLKKKVLEFKALIESGQIPPLEQKESPSSDEPGDGDREQ